MSVFFDLLFLLLLFGPAIFVIIRHQSWASVPGKDMSPTLGALIWTACALGFVWLSQHRAWNTFENACEEFQIEIAKHVTGDDAWNAQLEADWWATCHPEDFDDPTDYQ